MMHGQKNIKPVNVIPGNNRRLLSDSQTHKCARRS